VYPTVQRKEEMMPRVKIKDLPREHKLTKEEIQKVTGGAFDGHVLSPPLPTGDLRTTGSLLDARADRLKSISKIDRFVLPNMMHDAGP
jgi:hypothetical protein